VELILDILHFKSHSGTPTYSYWASRCNTLLLSWTTEETLSFKKKWMSMAGRVNGIMTAFLTLVDYPSTHFQCCKDPEVVCIDGIVLSVESRRINTLTPWYDPSPLRARFSKKDDRYLVILNANQKEILRDYIRVGVFIEKFKELCDELPDPIAPFVFENILRNPGASGLVECPPLLTRFYQSLYKWISPACSFAPAVTWDMLESIVQNRKIQARYLLLLTEQSPVLHDLCSFITTLCEDPQKYKTGIDLLQFILERSKRCFQSPKPNYQSPLRPVGEGERTVYPSVTEEVLQTGAYFPGRPYHSVVRDIIISNETALCNKVYKKKGRLGAGTLLFWCGIHRKCLGFYIMQSAESCNTVYQLLET
jgi:hypothetical protein